MDRGCLALECFEAYTSAIIRGSYYKTRLNIIKQGMYREKTVEVEVTKCVIKFLLCTNA